MNTIKTIKEHLKSFSTSVCKRSCSLNKNEGDDPIESKRHSFFDSDKKNLGSGPAIQTNNWSANNFKKKKKHANSMSCTFEPMTTAT